MPLLRRIIDIMGASLAASLLLRWLMNREQFAGSQPPAGL
jgi:hypothetical protein